MGISGVSVGKCVVAPLFSAAICSKGGSVSSVAVVSDSLRTGKVASISRIRLGFRVCGTRDCSAVTSSSTVAFATRWVVWASCRDVVVGR